MIPGAPAPQPAAAGGAPMFPPHPAMQPAPGPASPAAPPQGPQPPAPPPPPTQTVFDANSFGAAIQLLKDQRQRGFRVDLETDSTIMSDQQAEQAAATAMIQAVGAFVQSAFPMAQSMPQALPLFGKMLLFLVRRFPVGVELEAAMEDAIEKLEGGGAAASMQNPKSQEIQAKQQIDIQKAQLDAQQSQQAHAMDLQVKQVGLQADVVKAQAEMQKAVLDDQHARMQHERDLAMAHTQAALGAGQSLMPQKLPFGAGQLTRGDR